jgi:hypothetical protein
VDGLPSEQSQVDQEVLAQLGFAEEVAIEEVLVLALPELAD